MLMILMMLAAWALMIGAHWLSPSEGLPVTLVFFGAPLLSGILMCCGNRRNDLSLGQTLSGALLWGILNAMAGSILIHLSQKILPAIPASTDVPQEHPAQQQSLTLLFFTILLVVLPPLMAVIWRIILNIRARRAK